MSKYFVCCVVSVFLSFMAWQSVAGAETTRGVSDDTIKIGVQASLTGPAGDHFMEWTRAMKNFYSDVNERGGVYGRKIKLIVEDTRYSIPLSSAAFKKLLYRDKVFAIFGPDGTGQTMVLKKQIKKLKVPSIGISQAKALVQSTRRYIFMAATPYEDQISVMFDYIINVLKRKNPKIAVVYLDVEYGKVCLRSAQARAKLYGIELAGVEVMPVMNLDATSQILNLKKADAEFIIIPMSGEFAINVIKTSRKFGLQGTFFGSHYTCEESILQSLPFPVEKYLGVNSYSSWYDESPGMVNVRNITKKFEPDVKYRSRMYMQGWISSLLWKEGFSRAGQNLTIDGFVDSLESIKNLDTGGVSGPITLSPTDHIAADYCRVYKCIPEKKVFDPVTDWITPVEKNN